jgi:hypothetical protein
MALNPAFTSASPRKLPIAFGYVLGQGDPFLTTVAQDGSSYNLYLLGEGEWDGPAMVNTYANPASSYPSQILDLNPFVHVGGPNTNQSQIPTILHFHSGAYSTKGAGDQPTSTGPDQNYDAWFPEFPTVTPQQCFSGIAYSIFKQPMAPTGFTRGTYVASNITGTCVYRSTRCRIFDAYGNVTAYAFTCNPAWHKVEAILRLKIKPQQPGIAGLTAAETACFNWESIAELAARNDTILSNGFPRFVGNYIFASDATLANLMETMMRVDRSYHRVQNGQIYLIGDDSRSSVFQMSATHCLPGSVKLSKKDIAKSPNVFVPRYRDINIPAVSAVETVSFAVTGSGPYVTTGTFTLDTDSPFLNWAYLVYGGSSDPTLDGNYAAPADGAGVANVQTVGWASVASPSTPASATGGYLGSNNARFSPRAPTTVRHLSAQKMVARQAPGLAAQPRVTPVYYDCGNSTYDQTNRLMKFERDRSLGTDIGVGWVAPISGTLTAYLEAVDANNVPLIQCGVHDVITLDDWVFPEKPGDYEIMEMQIVLELHEYNPNAATDVSDPPGDSYQTVSNSLLPLTGFAPVINPGWLLKATPIGTVASSGSLTITAPDMSIHVGGQPAATAYPGFSVAGVPVSSPVLLYVDDPSGVGTSPTYGMQAGSGPLTSPPPGRMLVFCGLFTMPSGSGSGPTPCVYAPTFPSSIL